MIGQRIDHIVDDLDHTADHPIDHIRMVRQQYDHIRWGHPKCTFLYIPNDPSCRDCQYFPINRGLAVAGTNSTGKTVMIRLQKGCQSLQQRIHFRTLFTSVCLPSPL